MSDDLEHFSARGSTASWRAAASRGISSGGHEGIEMPGFDRVGLTVRDIERMHFSFCVGDVGAEHGARGDVQVTAQAAGLNAAMRSFYVTDPDGVLVEFMGIGKCPDSVVVEFTGTGK
jgi:catechol 2,3-dioxygenase-like lactoylglutathione lyase family enzyme